MDISKCTSKLEMMDIFFPSFSFSQNKKPGQINLKTDIKVNFEQNSFDKDLYRTTITVSLNGTNVEFSLKLETIGIFRLDKTQLDDNLIAEIIQKNTVAIMFPFIRSQIALLTSQPGLSPVLLQPINVDDLIENMKNVN